MNKCVYYIDAVGGLVVCSHDALYMVKGSSFCREHVSDALRGSTYELTQEREELQLIQRKS